MGACGAFQAARAEVRGGMLCVRACRRAPPAVCMPKRPRIRSARAGQRPAPRHHQGEGHTAKSGRDSALARARGTVKCRQNPGQIKSEPRSDRIRTGGQMNRNPQVARLIDCSDVLFELSLPDCDGIVFLSTHELENVLVGHSCLAGFVERNVELRELGIRRKEEVEKHISREARRFYVAALIKYAWAHMYFRGLATGIGNVDHFRSDHGLVKEIRNAKQRIEQEFADNCGEFRQQLVEIGRWAKVRMDGVRKAGGNADAEIVRLADGKGLLIKLRTHWKFTMANEGLLVERVRLSDFAERFRAELVAVTGA